MDGSPAGEIRTEAALAHRPRLLRLAYRMLGDMDAAEDVVQEACLRWHRANRATIRSPEAWLATVVSRLALSELRRAGVEHANHEPQSAVSEMPAATSGPPPPDRNAELESDLSAAFLLLLERLAPDERVALLLRDIFGEEYAEIARILERSPAAVRQMVCRARVRARAGRRRAATSTEEHERLFERFAAALADDDPAALLEAIG